MTTATQFPPPVHPTANPLLERHPGFRRLFQPQALTVGLILPLETHAGRAAPTM